jgi:hypothetical protein
MTSGDGYRRKAAEFTLMAEAESDAELRAEFEHLAVAYLRLAEQADRNSLTDIVYETPLPKLGGDPAAILPPEAAPPKEEC